MKRTTRNSTGGRTQTVVKSDTARPKRVRKPIIHVGTTQIKETASQEKIATIINQQLPGEIGSSTGSAQQIPRPKRGRPKKKKTSLEQQVGIEAETETLVATLNEQPVGVVDIDSHTSPIEQLQPLASANKRKGGAMESKKKKKPKEEKPKEEKKPKEPVEKRLANFRGHCPVAIRERIDRAESQRIYMVSRKMVKDCHEEFAILGSTGNIYTVTIANLPNCTCPDFKKGYLCKHIIFVYIRVLRVNRGSPFIYQKALLTEELRSIFAKAAPDPTVLASKDVRDKYKTITSGETSESADDKRRPIEGDCPICYEPLEEKDRKNIVWCKEGCGNNLHKDCFEQWKKSKRGSKVTCVYCRSDWLDSTKSGISLNEEGYLNLGHVQGMNTTRDTTSYYRNYRTARNSWY